MPARNDTRNDTTACPACGQPFTPRGRRRWCSAACRQAAWRRRHPATPPPATALPAPASTPRDHTIYQCGDCGQRYLAEQWCPDCNQPCRRLGPGGPCPHCDEPVTVNDLITST